MDTLAEKLGHYLLLAQSHIYAVRHLPDLRSYYDEESKAWVERQLCSPPMSDPENHAAFLAFCDEICGIQPTTPGEHICITFAAMAASQNILEKDMLYLSSEDRTKITGAVRELLNDKLGTFQPGAPPFFNTQHHLHIPPPQSLEFGKHLLGQTIRYHSVTGEVKECTILDHGTSDRRGEWFLIAHGPNGSNEMMISVEEMKKILEGSIMQ